MRRTDRPPGPARSPAPCILHAGVAGRARIRVEQLYRRPSMEQVLEHELSKLRPVREVRASAITGSVLVLFDAGVPQAEVLDAVGSVVDALPRVSPTRETTVRPGGRRIRTRRLGAESPQFEAQTQHDWHVHSTQEALRLHATGAGGLDGEEAALRLSRFGPNALERERGRTSAEILLDQVKSAPTLMLMGSAVLSAATGGLSDAIAIVAVVAANSSIGYLTESSAERTIGSLEQGRVHAAHVLRDRTWLSLAAEQLVPGDVVRLQPGDTVPADGRLLSAQSLLIDESSLTGESLPVTKSPQPLQDVRLPLADRLNMVYRGTVVVGGSGVCVIVATGSATQIGHIAALTGGLAQRATPLQRQLDELSRTLVAASMAVCGGVLVVGALRGFRLLELLKVGVSLAVAAVPEGLPTVATTTLALGIRRMRALDVSVRKLGAVETLGAVQTICLDKTGTITANHMIATEVVAAGRTLRIEAGRLYHQGEAIAPLQDAAVRSLLEATLLCSEVQIETEEGHHTPRGSATETALVQVALDVGIDPLALREAYPLLDTDHRTQDRQFMVTLHADGAGRPAFVAVKGRPSQVLARCRSMLGSDGPVAMDEAMRESIRADNERMAGDALRVLAVAQRTLDPAAPRPQELAEDLVWLGLAGMEDPPRPGIDALLAQFHAAGIETVMITGDQSATALAIARSIGLARDGQLQILDSTRLDELEPDVLRSLAQQAQIFSRVSPAHKLAIVQALQEAGRVVAMTGDGINDGPALKAADVGVAMGESGTEAARDVADVVLLRDDLSTMITAIEQGRTTYDDVKKALQFILATNMTEIVMTFGAVAAGIPEPLTPMQLLWINLLTDVFPELALAVEPAESNVLTRPPRDPSRPMFGRKDLGRVMLQGSVISVSALAVYGYGIARYGIGPRARTLGFSGLTCAQLLHAFSARSEQHSLFDPGHLARNKYLPLTVGTSLSLQALTVVLPSLRRLLGTSPLGLGDLVVVLSSSLVPFFTNEALKVWQRERPTHHASRSSARKTQEPPDAD